MPGAAVTQAIPLALIRSQRRAAVTPLTPSASPMSVHGARGPAWRAPMSSRSSLVRMVDSFSQGAVLNEIKHEMTT
jgi:hypothetical protein